MRLPTAEFPWPGSMESLAGSTPAPKMELGEDPNEECAHLFFHRGLDTIFYCTDCGVRLGGDFYL